MTAIAETMNRLGYVPESNYGKEIKPNLLSLRRSFNNIGSRAATGIDNILFVAVGKPKARIKKLLDKRDKGEELSLKEKRELEQWESDQQRKRDKVSSRGGNGSSGNGRRSWIGR